MSGESIWIVVIIDEKNDFNLVISILMQNDQFLSKRTFIAK